MNIKYKVGRVNLEELFRGTVNRVSSISSFNDLSTNLLERNDFDEKKKGKKGEKRRENKGEKKSADVFAVFHLDRQLPNAKRLTIVFLNIMSL